MTPNEFCGCVGSADVLLGMHDDDVELREEQQRECHGSGERVGEAHDEGLVRGSHVQDEEGDPDDDGAVHCEADELGFIEVFRKVPCLEGVKCTKRNQEKVPEEGHQERLRLGVTLQNQLSWKSVLGIRGIWPVTHQTDAYDNTLHCDQDPRDHNLKR